VSRFLPSVGYLGVGTALGVVFVKSQVLSWYRIEEMFFFGSFHMFGIIGVAVCVAAAMRAVLLRLHVSAATGASMVVPPKIMTKFGVRYWLGGLVFGLGWALLGACPGPIFTLIGAGETIYIVPLLAAVAGTYAYGAVRHRLPH
jgi:uncharacterized protein